MRRVSSFIVCCLALLQVSACAKREFVRTCDEKAQPYERAVEHEKLKVPDGLDELDRLKELPLPEASTRVVRDENAPCLDFPPGVLTGEDQPLPDRRPSIDRGPAPRDDGPLPDSGVVPEG